MDVVVNMLAGDGWFHALGHSGATLNASALEPSSLLFETSLDGSRISMAVFTGLNGGHVMNMLLWENLAILHRLDGGVIMVLVNLTIDGGLHILVTGLHDLLLDDGGSNLLVDGGVCFTSILKSERT